eukprot:gene20501-26794_t
MDQDAKEMLREWRNAKDRRDFSMSDMLRDKLRAKGIEPERMPPGVAGSFHHPHLAGMDFQGSALRRRERGGRDRGGRLPGGRQQDPRMASSMRAALSMLCVIKPAGSPMGLVVDPRRMRPGVPNGAPREEACDAIHNMASQRRLPAGHVSGG